MQTTGINNIDETVTSLGGNKAIVPVLGIMLAAALMTATGVARAEAVAGLQVAVNADVENTGRNVRDRNDKTVTPQKQKSNRSDTKITAAIRKGIVNNKTLSTDAHNVKIITRKGAVTLRGPVENVAEKNEVQSIAEKTKGVTRVDNQLEPKTP